MRIFPRAVIALMLLFPSMTVFAKSDTQEQQKSHYQKHNLSSSHVHSANRAHASQVHKKNQYVYNRAYYNNRNHHRHYQPYTRSVGWSIGIGSGWNNGWYPYGGYYGSRWGYPWGRSGYYGASAFPLFGWSRPIVRPSQPKVIAPPQQITTSVQYSQGLTRLPDNAKVIQTSTGTQYEWQGVYYQYDWRTQTYQKVN